MFSSLFCDPHVEICLDHTLAALACERSAGDTVTRHAFASVSEICHPVT